MSIPKEMIDNIYKFRVYEVLNKRFNSKTKEHGYFDNEDEAIDVVYKLIPNSPKSKFVVNYLNKDKSLTERYFYNPTYWNEEDLG